MFVSDGSGSSPGVQGAVAKAQLLMVYARVVICSLCRASGGCAYAKVKYNNDNDNSDTCNNNPVVEATPCYGASGASYTGTLPYADRTFEM